MSTFQATGLSSKILQAVSDLGFTTPTPIQQQTIPYLIENAGDLIALAQTGTGKTAAFGLPLLELVKPEKRHVQALVLCPTRELCLQITDDFEAFSKYMTRVNVVAVYGGANINTQVNKLNAGAQIVAGTPGRTLDLIRRGDLDISGIDILVLDEADEMLDRGFKHDLDAILAAAPKKKHTWLFSATMPDEIARISRQYLYKPRQIEVGNRNEGAKKVTHEYFVYEKKGRYGFLRSMLRAYGDVYAIVFCRTKRKAKEIARRLQRDGFKAEALQGNMSQSQRDKAMAKFRGGKARILVATDVAARGVDIDDLTHVINFDLPDVDEVYIHRSGRTGRANRSGISVSILADEELNRVRGLERIARKPFEQKTLADIVPVEDGIGPDAPTQNSGSESAQPAQKQLHPAEDPHYKAVYDKLDEILAAVPEDDNLIDHFVQFEQYLGDISKTELLQRMVSWMSNRGEFRPRPKHKPRNEGNPSGNRSKSRHRGRHRSKGRR